jgi:hypothetical protein
VPSRTVIPAESSFRVCSVNQLPKVHQRHNPKDDRQPDYERIIPTHNMGGDHRQREDLTLLT